MILDVSTKEGYDIACALRGPDYRNISGLKWLFTSRLRSFVGVNEDSGGWVRGGRTLIAVSRLSITEDLDRLQSLYEGLTWDEILHWLAHTQDAFDALDRMEVGSQIIDEARELNSIVRAIRIGKWDKAKSLIEELAI